jgi:MFS family permease
MASCVILVSIAAQITTHLNRNGRSHQSSILFSGVGIGIAFTGIVTPIFNAVAGWQGSWIGIGICAIILSIVSLYLVKNVNNELPQANANIRKVAPTGNILLVSAYFLEGLGYIVMATFLITIVKETPGMGAYSTLSWIIVGLSAAISPLLWQMVSVKIGMRLTLTAAYLLQAFGMYAGIYLVGLTGIFTSAITFGGTFMAITSLTVAEGTHRGAGSKNNIIAVLTFAFAVGQIIAPPCAGWLAQVSGGFGLTLKIAGGCVFLGGVLSWLDWPRKIEHAITSRTFCIAKEVGDNSAPSC